MNNKDCYFLNTVLPAERQLSDETQVFKMVNLDIDGGFDWILLRADFKTDLVSFYDPVAKRKLEQTTLEELKDNLLNEIRV
jgi:hypothetical protein